MIEIHQSVFGVLCLIGAGVFTLAWPLGPRRGNHLLLSISIVIRVHSNAVRRLAVRASTPE
jgi:hypothetical protein